MSAPSLVPQGLEGAIRAREVRSVLALKDTWRRHAAANKARVQAQVSRLWLDANPKTGVLVAAGPSLDASLPELQAMDRRTHEVVAVDMALGFLLDHGVRPDYVICADASEAIASTLEVGALSAGVPLLLNVGVHPATGEGWQGPVYWFGLLSNIYDGDAHQWMQKDHEALSGVSAMLVPGGNVGSMGLSFLLSVRACPRVVLYGHDFCWSDDARFYCGGRRQDLAGERVAAETAAGTVLALSDTLGRPVRTNASLLNFAQWYADVMRQYPGVVENRTPTTILANGGTS